MIGAAASALRAQLAELMDLSDDLAQLSGRRTLWSRQHTDADTWPAAFTFDGDVYDGLRALDGWRPTSQKQQHLVILSGLYGVLRPLDRLHPYRPPRWAAGWPNRRGPDLYAFWVTRSRCTSAGGWPSRALSAGPRGPRLQGTSGRCIGPPCRPRVVGCVF